MLFIFPGKKNLKRGYVSLFLFFFQDLLGVQFTKGFFFADSRVTRLTDKASVYPKKVFQSVSTVIIIKSPKILFFLRFQRVFFLAFILPYPVQSSVVAPLPSSLPSKKSMSIASFSPKALTGRIVQTKSFHNCVIRLTRTPVFKKSTRRDGESPDLLSELEHFPFRLEREVSQHQ